MKVKELRSILNTLCVDEKVNEYDICISMDMVFTDDVKWDWDKEGKRFMLEER